ncbi:hypothetical protein DOS69_01820 [Staphylococcus felis]|nr:hypothetical protein DOS69_01820 [Staphylococcus felis]REI33623.1 hypothetical protein DOS82_05865 [Staphylococcus felis]
MRSKFVGRQHRVYVRRLDGSDEIGCLTFNSEALAREFLLSRSIETPEEIGLNYGEVNSVLYRADNNVLYILSYENEGIVDLEALDRGDL